MYTVRDVVRFLQPPLVTAAVRMMWSMSVFVCAVSTWNTVSVLISGSNALLRQSHHQPPVPLTMALQHQRGGGAILGSLKSKILSNFHFQGDILGNIKYNVLKNCHLVVGGRGILDNLRPKLLKSSKKSYSLGGRGILGLPSIG